MSIVTVVMPVYNGERYLAEAMESVLGQTLADFDLVVVDDGSTDRSAQIVESYGDPRVRLLRSPVNRGVAASLNLGLDAAEGVYVARMDADDVCLPDRLAKQVAFMDAHPEVGVCSAGLVFSGLGSTGERVWRPPADPDMLACRLLFCNVIGHPTVVLRAEVLSRFGLRYDTGYPHAEDYELWTRCAEVTRLVGMPEPLLRYREHPGSVSRRNAAAQAKSVDRIRRRQLAALGIEPSTAEAALHAALDARRFRAEAGYLDAAEGWLLRLADGNRRSTRYRADAFARMLSTLWREAGDFAVARGLAERSRVESSPLGEALGMTSFAWTLLVRRKGAAA